MTSFGLDLGVLPAGASRIQVESPAEGLGLEGADWSDRVFGTLDVHRSGDRISVRGKVEAGVTLECVRCLRRYEMPVEARIEVFADRAGSGPRLEEEELERDDGMRFHDGRRLDLGGEVREVLLLELPMAPRCRDDCPGLCPRCGADLNDGPCGCGPEAGPAAR